MRKIMNLKVLLYFFHSKFAYMVMWQTCLYIFGVLRKTEDLDIATIDLFS